MTNGEMIVVLLNALPYPEHISEINIREGDDVVYFMWRGDKFKFNSTYDSVSEIEGPFEVGSNKAILLRALIKRAILDTD